MRAACRDLASEARARVLALTGLPPICPDAPEWWGQLCAMPLPMRAEISAEEVRRRLFDDFAVEVPIHEWEGWRLEVAEMNGFGIRRLVARRVGS